MGNRVGEQGRSTSCALVDPVTGCVRCVCARHADLLLVCTQTRVRWVQSVLLCDGRADTVKPLSRSLLGDGLLADRTAPQSRACLVFHQPTRHLDGSFVPNKSAIRSHSSWHGRIPCSNLLGKHDKAPPACPVLGLICRGKAHTADSRRRAVGKEPRNGRGWTHPYSPCTFQANNVDFNTTKRDQILRGIEIRVFRGGIPHTSTNLGPRDVPFSILHTTAVESR